MALLTPPLDSVSSMPPQSAASPPTPMPVIHTTPSAPPAALAPLPQPTPVRMPSSVLPRGRHLGPGERVVYDVDSRLPGEVQPPQLEVTPITKYISDPCLVLGRQIAVNRNYICYGLKQGNIRVLNINSAVRALIRGYTQRVTDMAFFAEDVNLLASASVDGRVYVWKIDEGPDEENKPQITGKIVVAVQFAGNGKSYHPRICWHSHKQEILYVGIENCVLKIDTTKLGRGTKFSVEEPLKCPLEKLIDGVYLIGMHDGDVTDLSISQWMTTRLVSSSKDGTINIWEDRKTAPLAILRPHDGQPVNSVEFLTSPHRPDHIVLITAGPLNREIKIWASASEEGWLLPGDSGSWQCTQTLELRSSAEPRTEVAFYNQVVVLPRANLVLIANAKKNAIYAVHVDCGSCPAATRMDYIADFTVAMPILSLTGTSDSLPDGEQLVQVYCVQTQAIQQYALNLSHCLPPPNDNVILQKDSCGSHGFDSPSSVGLDVLEASCGSNAGGEPHKNVASPKVKFPASNSESPSMDTQSVVVVSSGISVHELTSSNTEAKAGGSFSKVDADAAHTALPTSTGNLDLPGISPALKNPPIGFERGPSLGNHDVDQSVMNCLTNKKIVTVRSSEPDIPSIDGNSGKDESKVPSEISMVPNSHLMFKRGGNTAHLITPAEILSGAISSSESTIVNQGLKGEEENVQCVTINNDVQSFEVEVKVVGESSPNQSESSPNQSEEVDFMKHIQPVPTEYKEVSVSSQTSGLKTDMAEVMARTNSAREARQMDNVAVDKEMEETSVIGEQESLDNIKDMLGKSVKPVGATESQSLPVAEGKKQNTNQSQSSGPSSPSISPLYSTDSLNGPVGSAGASSTELASSQILAMQETLDKLVAMQKELQNEMSTMLTVPITKEGKRVETSLGRSMERAVKANVDALWARFQEENAKHEKAERDRLQQITSVIANSVNKDIPAIMERTLKKEISAVGPSLARAVIPVIEKTISSAISESFQKGVGDKAVGQLEKSVNSKLEATVARQIQAQFQTSGKQALQDALRSSLETSVIPAFELSCKSMFEQVDTAFQKGMTEYTSTSQKQFETSHTPLALTLRDAINSTSSITQNMTSELADGQRKILALLAAGNPKTLNPVAMQQSNGPMTGRPEMQALSVQHVEPPLDPTRELARLISERKFDEAFTLALQRSDVSIVSWLCSQVDLHGICSMMPLPLSQGVLLALLQQLACDISNDTPKKLGWMTSVAVVINPTDPMITLHVRPILEQVYNILAHQRSSPATNATDIRAVMLVVNSVLMSCK